VKGRGIYRLSVSREGKRGRGEGLDLFGFGASVSARAHATM